MIVESKPYRLINRNNPMEGIEVGSVINDRTVLEIFEPEIVLDKNLGKRKKYFVVVKCKNGHERKVEIRSVLAHGCPKCNAPGVLNFKDRRRVGAGYGVSVD